MVVINRRWKSVKGFKGLWLITNGFIELDYYCVFVVDYNNTFN